MRSVAHVCLRARVRSARLCNALQRQASALLLRIPITEKQGKCLSLSPSLSCSLCLSLPDSYSIYFFLPLCRVFACAQRGSHSVSRSLLHAADCSSLRLSEPSWQPLAISLLGRTSGPVQLFIYVRAISLLPVGKAAGWWQEYVLASWASFFSHFFYAELLTFFTGY